MTTRKQRKQPTAKETQFEKEIRQLGYDPEREPLDNIARGIFALVGAVRNAIDRTRAPRRDGQEGRGEDRPGSKAPQDKPESEPRPRPEGQAEHDARIDRAARAMLPAIIEKLATAGERGRSLRDFRDLLVGKNVAIDRAAELAVSEGVAVKRMVRGFARYFPAEPQRVQA